MFRFKYGFIFSIDITVNTLDNPPSESVRCIFFTYNRFRTSIDRHRRRRPPLIPDEYSDMKTTSLPRPFGRVGKLPFFSHSDVSRTISNSC